MSCANESGKRSLGIHADDSSARCGRYAIGIPTDARFGKIKNNMSSIGKALIGLGVMFVLVGLLLVALERVGVRQWRLPGDIVIHRDGFHFYFPLGTSLLISLILTLLLTFLAWLAGRAR